MAVDQFENVPAGLWRPVVGLVGARDMFAVEFETQVHARRFSAKQDLLVRCGDVRIQRNDHFTRRRGKPRLEAGKWRRRDVVHLGSADEPLAARRLGCARVVDVDRGDVGRRRRRLGNRSLL